MSNTNEDDMRTTRTTQEQLRVDALNLSVSLEAKRLEGSAGATVDGDTVITNAKKFFTFLKRG